MKASNFIKGKSRTLLKRILKPIFKNHVYVSKYELIRGMKVTGNLGFLETPTLSYEDRLLMNLNLSGKTAYDIGAHIGLITLFLSRSVGEVGQVISFEPNPETFAFLRKNAEINNLTNIRAANLGLAEKHDKVLLVFGEADGALGTMDKLRHETMRKNKKTKSVWVEVYALDEYISKNSLPDPDFIKVDVEGYEYNVLLGMQNTIDRCRPAMLVEMHGSGEQKLERVSKIIQLLATDNYKVRDIVSRATIEAVNIEQAGKFLTCEPDEASQQFLSGALDCIPVPVR